MNYHVMTPRRSRRDGFTLVEVMVVVGILAVLVSIVSVGTMNASKKARELRCRRNLHEIVLALHQYQLEHNGKFPLAGRNLEAWIPALSRYVPGKDIFVCPADNGVPSPPWFATRYDYLPRYKDEVYPDGGFVRYSPHWLDVFKKRGANTPILTCNHHQGGILFARVNGVIEKDPIVRSFDER